MPQNRMMFEIESGRIGRIAGIIRAALATVEQLRGRLRRFDAIALAVSPLAPTAIDRAWIRLVVPMLGIKRKLGAARLLLPMRIEKFGVRSRIWLRQPTDAIVLYEVFVEEAYREPWNDPSVVFDLGANIGLTSLYYYLRGARSIYAFEPDPAAYRQAKANLPADVVIVPAAITGQDGPVSFRMAKETYASSLGGADAQSCITVEGLKLETAMSRVGVGEIDLLKVDIEGAEWDVLRDAPLDRIGAMAGEFHADLVDVTPSEFAAAFDITLKPMNIPTLPVGARYSFTRAA